MEDIYDCFQNTYTYTLTNEEKFSIIDSIQNEFEIRYTADTFECFGVKRPTNWESLWGCNPPLSNIRYIVLEFGQNFDSSKTDTLCRTIHENKIQQIYLQNVERKRMKI